MFRSPRILKLKPPVFVLKTGGFGSSGEIRLHLRLPAQIKERLGQMNYGMIAPGNHKYLRFAARSTTLAGGARSRCIELFESPLVRKKNMGMADAIPIFLVRVGRFELPAS